MKICWTFVLMFFYSSLLIAEQNHSLIRRVTVFPIFTTAEHTKSAEKTWWKIREKLTFDKRFLVASRNFLIKKDVYQKRKELKPADAIILGQLLDAHAVMTTFLDKRTMHMHAYETKNGLLLWKSKIKLHPSLPVQEQLEDAGVKLVNDFMASVPYQGYLFLDKIVGKPVYQDGSDYMIKAKLSELSRAKVGDIAQIIKLKSKTFDPLFLNATDLEIVAEGRIVKLEKYGVVTILLERHIDLNNFKEYDLVRIPSEYKRISELFKIQDGLKKRIGSEYYSPEVTEETEKVKERKPLIAALTFIVNIAAFLLLAL